MSETIKHHLGDDWIRVFNVYDYYHTIEECLEEEEEEDFCGIPLSVCLSL